MKKLFFLLISFILLFANSYKFAQNILGEKIYSQYKNVIQSSLDKNASLKNTLIFLENNGLINLSFQKIKTIHPTFILKDNNPIFETKTLYDILRDMGYYDFYPIHVYKNSNEYLITLEMKAQNYVNPLNLIKKLKKRGCKLTNVKKNKNDFIYYINCLNEKIYNAVNLSNKIDLLHNINGIYWIKPNHFDKIVISTSKFDFWHPYVVFYDKNLNILNIISTSNLIRQEILKIPQNTAYIKVADYFTKENIKRGIFIKGLK